MRIAVCSTQTYDRQFLQQANQMVGYELVYFEANLNAETYQMLAGFSTVCVFVNDILNAPVLRHLARQGTRLVALRCAGFNNVDLAVAQEVGITVVRVPAYSPHSVAEHAVALMMALNRHIPRAYNRVRDDNFALQGLLGFEVRGKTVGIVGTGRIGSAVAEILRGFGCLCWVMTHSLPLNVARLALSMWTCRVFISVVTSLPCTVHLINSRTISSMPQVLPR